MGEKGKGKKREYDTTQLKFLGFCVDLYISYCDRDVTIRHVGRTSVEPINTYMYAVHCAALLAHGNGESPAMENLLRIIVAYPLDPIVVFYMV